MTRPVALGLPLLLLLLLLEAPWHPPLDLGEVAEGDLRDGGASHQVQPDPQEHGHSSIESAASKAATVDEGRNLAQDHPEPPSRQECFRNKNPCSECSTAVFYSLSASGAVGQPRPSGLSSRSLLCPRAQRRRIVVCFLMRKRKQLSQRNFLPSKFGAKIRFSTRPLEIKLVLLMCSQRKVYLCPQGARKECVYL